MIAQGGSGHPRTSRRSIVRISSAHVPTAMNASSATRWTTASDRVVHDRARATGRGRSATPWYSGVSQASGWRNAGSELIGKNVPENRNSGVIPNRKIVAEPVGRPLGGGERRDRGRERQPGQDRRRDREHDERRRRRAEQHDDQR